MIEIETFYRNVNRTEPILVNERYIAYIEIVDGERAIIHMANGETIHIYMDEDELELTEDDYDLGIGT